MGQLNDRCVCVCAREAVEAHHINVEDRPFLSSVLLERLAGTQSSTSAPWTGSELVPSLGASLGPNSASPLIRGGAQAQA